MFHIFNFKTIPIIHIDFHGKYTFGENWIEAGCTSLENYFKDKNDQNNFVKPIKEAFKSKMIAAYNDVLFGGSKFLRPYSRS